mgnify:CR=1 FL=1
MAENPDDVLHVEGGKPLNGTIKVRGAKNFVSKAMVAALLAPGKSVLKNVPEIRDVHVVSDLLRLHGVDVDVDGCERHCGHRRLACAAGRCGRRGYTVRFVAHPDPVFRPARAPFG